MDEAFPDISEKTRPGRSKLYLIIVVIDVMNFD